MLLELNGLEVDCVIGELPDERTRKQRLTIDVRLEIASESADSDDLSDTVDYATLGDAIRAALVSAECRMIERAAKVAHGICVSDPKVRSAMIRVTKAGAVPGLASATVSYP
jgi:dihydroneopterin aldolase